MTSKAIPTRGRRQPLLDTDEIQGDDIENQGHAAEDGRPGQPPRIRTKNVLAH